LAQLGTESWNSWGQDLGTVGNKTLEELKTESETTENSLGTAKDTTVGYVADLWGAGSRI
jgi:hypothetical protein